MRKLFIVILVSAFTILFIGSLTRPEQAGPVTGRTTAESPVFNGILAVAMDINLPGYFSFNGVPMGFNHDVLEHFAEHIGAKLTIIPQEGLNNSLGMLATGKADMVITMSKYVDAQNEAVRLLQPVYRKQYVVLGNLPGKPLTKKTLKKAMLHRNVIVKQDFTSSRAYNFWLDSVSNTAAVSYENAYNLIAALDRGEIDYLVCEKQEAEMESKEYGHVVPLYTFEQEESSAIFVSGMNRNLEKCFNDWIKVFRESPEYVDLYAMYFRNSFLNGPLRGKKINETRISPFDDLFRLEASKAGHDWRFISAIAYHESRFKPDVVSRRGAKGIMQIMPSIARSFNVSPNEIEEPQKNVEVALMLLNRIEESLKFNNNTSDYDKMCIILACYNGGIGHVMDARRLAAKYGENPNAWESVAKYLNKKSEKEFYTDELVRQGKFSGKETLRFVSNVMKRYSQYCRIIR